jgi:hypothetical protein
MGYATISEISRRWKVDPATARTALKRADILPCDLFMSPRYSWDEVLRKIEAWPAPTLARIDLASRLETADVLADQLGVTPQTIRNYGRAGLLHRIEITPRSIRYSVPFRTENESEAKTDELHKK